MRRGILLLLCAAATLAAQQSSGPFLELGFEQRVRNENWNNLFDYNSALDDERVQVRYRTRLWMKAPLGSNVDLQVGVNHETSQILRPDLPFKANELVFETANVGIKRLFVDGLSLRVGRQNLTYGEGFLVSDGTPGDGSRTMYFNAAVLSYSRKRSRLDLIGISNPRTDRYLPRINDQNRTLQDWGEQAIGVYYTGANLPGASIEAYYFYKKETGDTRPATHPQHQGDRHVHTGGGRLVRMLSPRWSLTGELALQWGAERPNKTIAASGGYAYLRRSFGSHGQHYVQGGFAGMSGDDPATPGRNENWDPLFSRRPKYSELYVHSYSRERGQGYWTNTRMWHAELGYSPVKPLAARFTYRLMDASHSFPGDARTFGNGARRGSLPQVRVDYTHNSHWKGHIIYERLSPGNFYSRSSAAYFLRFEVTYTLVQTVRL